MITIENKNQLTEFKKLSKQHDIRICKIPGKKEKFPVFYSVVEIESDESVILVPDFNRRLLTVKYHWNEMPYKEFKKAFLKEVEHA